MSSLPPDAPPPKRPAPRGAPAPRITYLEGLTDAQLCYWLTAQAPRGRRCVLAADDDASLTLARDIETLSGASPLLLLGDEASPFSLAATDARAAFGKAALREALLTQSAPRTLVISAAAAQGTWPPADAYAAARKQVQVGQDIDRDALIAHLVRCGYLRVNAVEDEGTFAVRGGVIDVFVPGAEEGDAKPWRLDLFGDELSSIRQIGDGPAAERPTLNTLMFAPIRDVVFDDLAVQRACAWIDAARERSSVPSRQLRERSEAIAAHRYFFGIESMWPAFYGEARAEGILAALLAHCEHVALADAHGIFSMWERRSTQSTQARERAEQSQGPQVAQESLVLPRAALEALLQTKPLAWHAQALLRGQKKTPCRLGDAAALKQELSARRKADANSDLLSPLVSLLRAQLRGASRVYVLASHHGAALRLRELLSARSVDAPLLPALPPVHAPDAAAPRFGIAVAPLSSSVDDKTEGVLLLSDADIFGAHKAVQKRARRPKASSDALNALHELRAGDCVIHQDHGIGRYIALVRLTLDGVDGDFVQLSYADDDKLYVPVFRLSVLHRYHGLQNNARLDKLGSGRFEKAKRRVRDAVLTMAHGMLALEAKRKSQTGFALPKPDERYAEFEASFPYVETPDQARAITDTLADLQQATPMDRLICGDVGFGKTEVALRAAFLAAHAGKQVAMLVPTTVLVEQHRDTFAARLSPFAISVAALSRFTSDKERKDIFARTADKRLDVLIGTHRLLSQDLHFADLGLLIVDEEQRFGVKHKERLKQLRAHVHVMTMSATPIPRTLHMATSGMRQLSVISTPPQSRSPIKTEVLQQDDAVVAEAIEREMKRGGQTFVVYNRVEGIGAVRDRIVALVPDAKVLLAHGQMDGKQLAQVMEQFVHRHAHVLVCTAIIESGIDIPSVNTMVVLDAHNYGLSQLYQLRGRIGRGRDRGYAYLMLPPDLQVGKDVAERMGLLKRFSTLGAGFQVATHDLEMRGAGDLLGSDQSGHIAAVGFELYSQLLGEAMEAARGHTAREQVEPDIKVPVAAVFPERYMREPIDRLTFYQRMAEAQSDEAVYDLLGEVGELFGPPPPEAEALAELMVLRRRLQALGASNLTAAMDATSLRVGVSFVPSAAVDRQSLFELCQADKETYRALPSGRLSVRLPLPPLQPADPDRGHDMDYVRGVDMLAAIRRGLAPLTCLPAPS